MNLNNILSQLGISAKETVYMSVTPGVGVELIQLDVSARTVKGYAYRPLEYNESLREISYINSFKNAVTELFDELKISIKSNIILSIPMVLFGQKELPLLLGDDSVTEALISEVEQSYIFKRYEPVVSWYDGSNDHSGDTRKLFYSAVQKNAIDDIKSALEDLGASLVGIEISLVSLLKALAFSGLLEGQMQDDVTWNLVIVNSNGYSICSMQGKNIIEYYEEPLAIKSFEGEEVYNAISASAQISLMSFPANYVCIVSETDFVSAKILASRLPVDSEISYIENNSFKENDIIPVSLDVTEESSEKISLEAIGVAVGNNINIPVKFNFLNNANNGTVQDDPDEPVHVELGSFDGYISPNMAIKMASVVAVILLVIIGTIAFLFPFFGNKKQANLDEINSKLESVQGEIKKLEQEQNKYENFSVADEIKKVLRDNRTKLMAYIALGESVPKKLWLTYFITKDDGKIDVKGVSSNVEDVYTFYRNMKDSLINNQLKLYKLEMKSDSIEDSVGVGSDYEFEITNMSETEMNPVAETEANAENNKKPATEGKKEENGQLLNKPLLNSSKDE